MSLLSKLGAVWCMLMHDAPRLPIHGAYRCWTCGRQHRSPFA